MWRPGRVGSGADTAPVNGPWSNIVRRRCDVVAAGDVHALLETVGANDPDACGARSELLVERSGVGAVVAVSEYVVGIAEPLELTGAFDEPVRFAERCLDLWLPPAFELTAEDFVTALTVAYHPRAREVSALARERPVVLCRLLAVAGWVVASEVADRFAVTPDAVVAAAFGTDR